MRIFITSVMVEDQAKALEFYTGVLGFVKKTDVPASGGRWLTVVSPAGPDDVELLLQPIGLAPARTFQNALREAGIPSPASPCATSAKSTSARGSGASPPTHR